MTINKDDYYLKNIELCKKLEPIMKKKGIDEDSYIIIPPLTGVGAQSVTHQLKARAASAHLFKGTRDLLSKYKESRSYEVISTWIKPSLEAALKDEYDWIQYMAWAIEARYVEYIIKTKNLKMPPALQGHIVALYKIAVKSIGQESLEALAQLIILLDEEGVE